MNIESLSVNTYKCKPINKSSLNGKAVNTDKGIVHLAPTEILNNASFPLYVPIGYLVIGDIKDKYTIGEVLGSNNITATISCPDDWFICIEGEDNKWNLCGYKDDNKYVFSDISDLNENDRRQTLMGFIVTKISLILTPEVKNSIVNGSIPFKWERYG